jgi:hypothetical protein
MHTAVFSAEPAEHCCRRTGSAVFRNAGTCRGDRGVEAAPGAPSRRMPVWYERRHRRFKPRMQHSAMTFAAPKRTTFDRLDQPTVTLQRASQWPRQVVPDRCATRPQSLRRCSVTSTAGFPDDAHARRLQQCRSDQSLESSLLQAGWAPTSRRWRWVRLTRYGSALSCSPPRAREAPMLHESGENFAHNLFKPLLRGARPCKRI